jgi:trehalose 6-phosphate phosphatase
MDFDDVLGPLRAAADTSVIVLDFDGTLAPIVDDPATAAPVDGVDELLVELSHRYAGVVIVSGRPLDFLLTVLPSDVGIVGLYGLEGLEHGRRWEHPNGGVWREVIEDVVTLARGCGPAGMRVESKGLSATFHYRGHPELGPTVLAYATAKAERAGLDVRPARMSVELHPPIDTDKGAVVERIAEDAKAILYVGDDAGDLSAFGALDRLRRDGVQTIKVAVASDEAPTQLLEQADLVVDGPERVRDLLASLAA